MKITVIGAGAIGTLLAYKLSKAGEEITIIAKSEQISEIDNKLIYAGTSKVEEIPIITKTEIEKTDYIIIASKSYDVDKIIDSVKDKEVPIMFCQNGLKILDLIERKLKDKTISYMVTGNGVSKSGPARIKHNGVGFTYIGNIGQETDYLTKKIVSMLKSVNFNAEIANNITEFVWLKAVINSVINPIGAYHNVRNGELVKPEFKKKMKILCKESASVALANSIKLPLDPWDEIVKIVNNTANNKCSMLQDIDNEQKTEIEQINGEIIRLSKLLKISVPMNQKYYERIITKTSLYQERH